MTLSDLMHTDEALSKHILNLRNLSPVLFLSFYVFIAHNSTHLWLLNKIG